jgi:hypothetical protein
MFRSFVPAAFRNVVCAAMHCIQHPGVCTVKCLLLLAKDGGVSFLIFLSLVWVANIEKLIATFTCNQRTFMSNTAVSFNFTLIWSAHCLSLLGSPTSSQSLTDTPLARGDTAHLHRCCRLRSQPLFWSDPACWRTGVDHK